MATTGLAGELTGELTGGLTDGDVAFGAGGAVTGVTMLGANAGVDGAPHAALAATPKPNANINGHAGIRLSMSEANAFPDHFIRQRKRKSPRRATSVAFRSTGGYRGSMRINFVAALGYGLLFSACYDGAPVVLDAAQSDGPTPVVDAASPDASAAVVPANINALKLGDAWLALIGDTVGRRLAFVLTANEATAYDESIALSGGTNARWRSTIIADAGVVPMNDHNGDGYPDVLAIGAVPSGLVCDDNGRRMARTLRIYSGADGALLHTHLPFVDECIPINSGATVAYTGLFVGAVQGGEPVGAFAMAPQYHATGVLHTPTLDASFYTAETASYAAYTAARPMLQPAAQGRSYAALQQPLNGLIVNVAGTTRYIATTSGRFLQYALAPYSAMQLTRDTPFLARPDLVGRGYGLLSHDTLGNDARLTLVAGTSAADLYQDVRAGHLSNVVTGHDLYAAIERHVSVYDATTGQVQQIFYSYAHDNNDGNTYRNRLSFPAFGTLPRSDSSGSSTLFNLFDGNTWNVYATNAAGTGVTLIVANAHVWDARQVDNDTVDVLLSPIDTARNVLIPDFLTAASETAPSVVGSWRNAKYFPQAITRVMRWRRAGDTFEQLAELPGIPYLDVAFPNGRSQATSTGFMFRALWGYTASHAVLVTVDFDGTKHENRVTW